MTKLPAAGEVRNVFVYGSLLAEEVVRMLIGRIPPWAAAYVNNYHRYSIHGVSYPAIAPKEGGRVEGKVYFDLTDHEQAVFDEFESDDYRRHLIDAVLLADRSSDGAASLDGRSMATASTRLDGSQRTVTAHVYSWAEPNDPDLYGSWDYEKFRREGMPEFLNMCGVFRAEFSRQWGPPPEPVE